MDIWGLCTPCNRWFYCEGADYSETPTPSCPACDAEPAVFVNHAGDAPGRLRSWADRLSGRHVPVG
ncbi:MAG: hypothetical protein ACRD0K_26405 [Egibacteraceae bacterium]